MNTSIFGISCKYQVINSNFVNLHKFDKYKNVWKIYSAFIITDT